MTKIPGPSKILVLVCSKFHSTHDPEQSIPKHCQSNPKAIPKYSKVFQSIPKYPKTSQNIPKYPKVPMARNCPPKIPPCTVLFWSARLLILRKFCPLHVYFFLHSSPILVCTFINFEKKFPPARSYFGLHVY